MQKEDFTERTVVPVGYEDMGWGDEQWPFFHDDASGSALDNFETQALYHLADEVDGFYHPEKDPYLFAPRFAAPHDEPGEGGREA